MAFIPANNVTTSDDYTDAATVICNGAARLNLDINNAAVYYQLGQGSPPAWEHEVFCTPKFLSLDPLASETIVCDAVRVRSAAPGQPAQLTIQPR